VLVLAVPVRIIANLVVEFRIEGQGPQIHRELQRCPGPVLDKHTPQSVHCHPAEPWPAAIPGLKVEV